MTKKLFFCFSVQLRDNVCANVLWVRSVPELQNVNYNWRK